MDTEIQLGGHKHGETHNKKPCLLDNTLSSSAVNTLLVSCHETSSINRQGQVTVACQTRVGCARAQWKLHDPQMQTLCLTIIIPFLSPLVCGLIISAAAVTERFIDNSSGARVCVCMSNCASLRAHMWHQAAISAPTSGSFLSQLTQSPFTPAPQGNLFLFFSFFPPFVLSCFLSEYLLGTPDTSLRGLSTLNALRALTSKPAAFPPIGVAPSPLVACSRIALNNLGDRNEWNKYHHPLEVNVRISETKVNRDITSSTATVCAAFSTWCYQAW